MGSGYDSAAGKSDEISSAEQTTPSTRTRKERRRRRGRKTTHKHKREKKNLRGKLQLRHADERPKKQQELEQTAGRLGKKTHELSRLRKEMEKRQEMTSREDKEHEMEASTIKTTPRTRTFQTGSQRKHRRAASGRRSTESESQDQSAPDKHHGNTNQGRSSIRGGESGAGSGEEEHGGVQPGPLDITTPEHVDGTNVHMEFGISAMADELGRNRYIEKKRSSHTFKIIRDPVKLNQISRDMVNEPTEETTHGVRTTEEIYYGVIIMQYVNRYLWE